MKLSYELATIIVLVMASSQQAYSAEPKVNERPALPFPPGVTVQSQCGVTDDLQDVELYDGSLGVSKNYVVENEPTTVQLQWLDEASLKSRLPGYSPGNVAGARWCTGTLFTDRLVITAGHCFDSQTSSWGWVTPFKIGDNGDAQYAPPEVLSKLQVANFGYQVNGDTGSIRIPDVYPISNLVEYRLGSLDYAIVELGRNAAGHFPGEKVPPALIALGSTTANQPLGIIQHPQGLPKKIEAGHLVEVSEPWIYYDDVDTLGGSSGASVRNEKGKIVGVHTNGGCIAGTNTGANRGVDINAISKVSSKIH